MRAGPVGLTSGVRSGGFFLRACLAPGSTGEFMAAAPAPEPPSQPLAARATAHSPWAGGLNPLAGEEGTPDRGGHPAQANKPSQHPPRVPAHARLAREAGSEEEGAQGRMRSARTHNERPRAWLRSDVRAGAVELALLQLFFLRFQHPSRELT